MDTKLLPRGGLILCAVSGGADSMYLLARLHELGCAVAAAHYNHGLRGAEADRDEAFVRDWCAARNIPFVSERGDAAAFAAEQHMGLEAAARTLRYAFLERAADEMGAAAIATAHTADDNAETMLLRLARGTGLKGLGGIPPVRGRIVRPMLDTTRAQVEAYLAAHEIDHVEDSTNASDAYARNRMRHGAAPALASVDPAYARAMGQTAALAREDEAFLEELARAFLREHADENSVDAAALAAQPWPIGSRAVRLMAGRDLSLRHVKAILETAAKGGAADVPGLRVVRWGDRLVFGAEQASAIQEQTLPVPGTVYVPSAGCVVRAEKISGFPCEVNKSYNIFFFQCENICGSITVTGRMPGDSYRPAGRGCTKKVRRLLREAGVPPWERDGRIVLRDGAGILAVQGFPPAERAAARPGDRGIIEIELRPAPEGKETGYAF